MRIESRVLPEQLPGLGDLPPLLTRLYAARGVRTPRELDRSLRALLPWNLFKGIDRAVQVLRQALELRQSILIVGDFDCDGATASAVAVVGLRALGAARVDYLVPNRFEYGYGLTPEIVEVALQRQPDVLVTVDNGISSVEGVAAARAAGLRVVVTDHHLPGAQLPEADAIVNPSQPGCDFPSKAIAGVGVIFYVLMALRAALREDGWFSPARPEPNLGELLDLVALGTVADVVPLDANNRILVHQGLARIRAGRCRPGIRALLEVARRPAERLASTDLGFIIGPRLNAAGRLDDMSLGIECLLTDDEQAARDMAGELDSLNRDRKAIEQGMQQQALQMLDSASLQESEAAADPGLIGKFGGHAMAAGLSLPAAHFEAFCQAFDQEVRRQLSAEDLTGRLLCDGELAAEEFSLQLAAALRDAGPWGQHFPEPGFHGEFTLIQQRLVGERHLKLVLQPNGGTEVLDAIAFNIDPEVWPDPTIRRARLVYSLDVNEYRGRQSLQLMVRHLQAC